MVGQKPLVFARQDRLSKMRRDFFELSPMIKRPLVLAHGELVLKPGPSRSNRKGGIYKPQKEDLKRCQDKKEKEKFKE